MVHLTSSGQTDGSRGTRSRDLRAPQYVVGESNGRLDAAYPGTESPYSSVHGRILPERMARQKTSTPTDLRLNTLRARAYLSARPAETRAKWVRAFAAR